MELQAGELLLWPMLPASMLFWPSRVVLASYHTRPLGEHGPLAPLNQLTSLQVVSLLNFLHDLV